MDGEQEDGRDQGEAARKMAREYVSEFMDQNLTLREWSDGTVAIFKRKTPDSPLGMLVLTKQDMDNLAAVWSRWHGAQSSVRSWGIWPAGGLLGYR